MNGDIEKLVKECRLEEAVEMLGALIEEMKRSGGSASDQQRKELDKELAGLYFSRGKLYWRLSRRGEAQSDYARAVALDPQSPASIALGQAREVEDFFNPDLYNP
ncbi:MAG: hypothetical protein K2K72_02630 [Duncaniella sp.]|nr:hypothetical protein [Duncaniella sp.]